MATAAIIGGGLLIGGVAAGIGAGKQADAIESASEAQLEQSQAFQDQQQANADKFIPAAQQAQQAQLALLGQGGDPAAAANLLNSPLVQALNTQNTANINAQATSSGVSGGNLLSALQAQNQANILQAGFGGLGQIAGQSGNLGLGFTGQAGVGLGMANQAQAQLGQAQGAGAAAPWLAAANTVNQGTQLASFGLGGGFGVQSAPAQQPMQTSQMPFSPTTGLL